MKRRGGKLKDEHKIFVIQRLACFDTPKEAAEALNAEFGVEVSPQACEAYDPNKRAGRNMSARWKDMFQQARKDFLENAQNHVPIANKTVRLREMQKAYLAHKSRRNWVAAMQVLEQVAKEVGEAFTNRREITGKDGGPMQVEYTDLTDQELNRHLLELLRAGGVEGESDEG